MTHAKRDLRQLLWLCAFIGAITAIATCSSGCGNGWAVDFNDDGSIKRITHEGRTVPIAEQVAPAPAPEPPAPASEPVKDPEPEPEPDEQLTPEQIEIRDLNRRAYYAERHNRLDLARRLHQRIAQKYGDAHRAGGFDPFTFASGQRRTTPDNDDPLAPILRNAHAADADLDRTD